MKKTTYQELMEYCDGRMTTDRAREMEQRIAGSPRLQQEVRLIRSLERSVRAEMSAPVPARLRRNVLAAILPARQESFWFRVARNSSGLFAMAIVLTMVGIVIASGPGTGTREHTLIPSAIQSYRTLYDGAVDRIAEWSSRSLQPVSHTVNSPFGKFLLVGLSIFILFIVLDEVVGKRYFHGTLKR